MVEAEKKFTPIQELEIRQLVRISKLLYDLDLEFRQQGKDWVEHPWIDDRGQHRTETINKVFLAGLRKIRNNIYLALGKDGFTEEANKIIQNYLTADDITMRDKFREKSVADQAVT